MGLIIWTARGSTPLCGRVGLTTAAGIHRPSLQYVTSLPLLARMSLVLLNALLSSNAGILNDSFLSQNMNGSQNL